jgi:hypothetical protein
MLQSVVVMQAARLSLQAEQPGVQSWVTRMKYTVICYPELAALLLKVVYFGVFTDTNKASRTTLFSVFTRHRLCYYVEGQIKYH